MWSPFAGSSVYRANNTDNYGSWGCSSVCMPSITFSYGWGGVACGVWAAPGYVWNHWLAAVDVITFTGARLVNTNDTDCPLGFTCRAGRDKLILVSQHINRKSNRLWESGLLLPFLVPTPLPTPAYKRRSRNHISVPVDHVCPLILLLPVVTWLVLYVMLHRIFFHKVFRKPEMRKVSCELAVSCIKPEPEWLKKWLARQFKKYESHRKPITGKPNLVWSVFMDRIVAGSHAWDGNLM